MQTESVLSNWKGWAQSYLPIALGEMPRETISLAELANAGTFARIIPRLASAFDADTRYASLTLLHYAVGAVMNLLVAPFVLDAVTIEAHAAQLGIVIQENGVLSDLWAAADLCVCREREPIKLGAQLLEIFEPLVATTQAAIPLKGRGVRLVLYDAVYRGCESLQRANDVALENGWIENLLAAMGRTDTYSYRTFTVTPDAGAPVEMTIPRVCCVLAKRVTAGACPTCPKYTDRERIQNTTEWLRSFDEIEFRQVTGRARIRGIGSPIQQF